MSTIGQSDLGAWGFLLIQGTEHGSEQVLICDINILAWIGDLSINHRVYTAWTPLSSCAEQDTEPLYAL